MKKHTLFNLSKLKNSGKYTFLMIPKYNLYNLEKHTKSYPEEFRDMLIDVRGQIASTDNPDKVDIEKLFLDSKCSLFHINDTVKRGVVMMDTKTKQRNIRWRDVRYSISIANKILKDADTYSIKKKNETESGLALIMEGLDQILKEIDKLINQCTNGE